MMKKNMVLAGLGLVIGGATLDLYDKNGKHSGHVPDKDFAIENNIPGVGYEKSNGVVVAMLPEGVYDITLTGTQDEGAAQLRINRLEQGVVNESFIFESIAITESSSATITLNTDNLNAEMTLRYLYTGESEEEEIGVLSQLTGTESMDMIPPISTITISEGRTVTITAQDNEGGAGISQILYSTEEEPTTYEVYSAPFQLPAEAVSVTAIAIDRAGNVEYPATRIQPADQSTTVGTLEVEDGDTPWKDLPYALIGFFLIVIVVILLLRKRKRN